ncbi:hypothetical protein M413DRAFT_30990 [Hebeloma cylindrosporum]|uniref:DUF6533 domain-containing protein n=1 Tax=Hebeloma cylindrosporum TaxID=76867 RepID=A0A0C3BYZ4_HEBCY|nr:hypothetical protein M413DRAFT_30990 [Hebeloma cylindrosporum h7]
MPDNFSREENAIHLNTRGLFPVYAVLSALVWVVYDYFITLEDEVTHFWSRKLCSGTLIFFWIRYYTIFLIVFDTIEIFSFSADKIMMQSLVLGAVIEKTFVNGVLFAISVGVFIFILVDNTLQDKATTGNAPGGDCPTFKGGGRWAQWLPATFFEFILFTLAVYKTIVSSSAKIKLNGRWSLTAILLHENIVYFFVVGCVLVFNNLMVVTKIPWFGFGPFHAALGVATCRMLIHLRKFASGNLELQPNDHSFLNFEVDPMQFTPVRNSPSGDEV